MELVLFSPYSLRTYFAGLCRKGHWVVHHARPRLESQRWPNTTPFRFSTTISAWTQAGCKDASQDPSAKTAGEQFVQELPDWCRTKKAGAAFFWFCFRMSHFILSSYLVLNLISSSRLASSSWPHLPRIPDRQEDISSTRHALRPACRATSARR